MTSFFEMTSFLKGGCDDCGTDVADDCGVIRSSFGGAGVLGESVLVLVHGICGAEFVSVGVYQLVPDDEHPAQIGRTELNKDV
jgi:hypothetical protein